MWADHRFVLFAHERNLTGDRASQTLEALDPVDPGLTHGRPVPGDAAREALWAETGRLLDVGSENHLAHEVRLALLLARERFRWHTQYPYYAGLARRALGDPRGALGFFEGAIALDADYAPAYPALTDVALAAGSYRRGIEVLQSYLRRRDGWPTAEELLLLGNLRYRAHDPRGAVDAYERALWTTHDRGLLRAEIENNLGNAYLDLDEPERALPLLEAALTRLTPFHAAEFNRARAWAKLGKVEAAREVFTRLAQDEATPPAIRSRALAMLRQPGGTAGQR